MFICVPITRSNKARGIPKVFKGVVMYVASPYKFIQHEINILLLQIPCSQEDTPVNIM